MAKRTQGSDHDTFSILYTINAHGRYGPVGVCPVSTQIQDGAGKWEWVEQHVGSSSTRDVTLSKTVELDMVE